LQKRPRVGWRVLRGNPGVKYVDWGNVDIFLFLAISLLSLVSFVFPHFWLFPGFIFLFFSSIDGLHLTREWYGHSEWQSGMFYWGRARTVKNFLFFYLNSILGPIFMYHLPEYLIYRKNSNTRLVCYVVAIASRSKALCIFLSFCLS